MEIMQNPTAENPPDQNIAVEQESNEVVLAMQCEVRFAMLVPLVAYYMAIAPVRAPP